MSWSLSRTSRFPSKKIQESSEFTLLPSTLDLRSTGIGYGRRWKPHNLTGMDSPPPGTYNLPSLASRKGPKIVKDAGTEKTRYCTPGPGTYELLGPLGKNAPKIALKSRIQRKLSSETPAPGAYSPSFSLTHYSGYSNITFGLGERTIVHKKFDGPGPGAYKIYSKFDKK